jgi:ribosome biogenesis GTPase / thiamine phosphate phosphatase
LKFFASHGSYCVTGVFVLLQIMPRCQQQRKNTAEEILKMSHGDTLPHDQGVVVKKNVGNYVVHAGGRMVSCSLSTRLRKELIYPTAGQHGARKAVREVKVNDHVDPVAIGDVVRFLEIQGSMGQIIEVLPRRNRLARRTAAPMPGAHTFEQVIAANVDQVLPVFAAADPPPHWNMLDRYLVSAESMGLPVQVVITKLDLAKNDDGAANAELQNALEEYRRIGYPMLCTSVVAGEGLLELRQALAGRVSVLVGKSGVGKTSLLNALQPVLGLRVGEVNQITGKGRHTTTSLEMFLLDFGGAIVDTPGVREFGLWDLERDDLASFFPEMRPFVGRCRFGLDCQHDDEPGCAIRKAVTSGQISPRRYQSYLRLKEDGYFI